MDMEFKMRCTLTIIVILSISSIVPAQPQPISIAYVYDGYSSSPVDAQTIIPWNPNPNYLADDDAHMEPKNPLVHATALKIIGHDTGPLLNAAQLRGIYRYQRYADDLSTPGWVGPYKVLNLGHEQYSNETIKFAREFGVHGIGVCWDYSMFVAALIVSLGGHARIVGTDVKERGGHVYPEVYLGRLVNNYNPSIHSIFNEILQYDNADKIYFHRDTATDDLWLNFDLTADYPGGPFMSDNKTGIVEWIDESFADTYPGWSIYTRHNTGQKTIQQGSPQSSEERWERLMNEIYECESKSDSSFASCPQATLEELETLRHYIESSCITPGEKYPACIHVKLGENPVYSLFTKLNDNVYRWHGWIV